MIKLSSINKHFKQGKLHHIVLSFTGGNKPIKHTVQPEDEVVVLEDARHIYIKGECIPFPAWPYEKIRYLGRLHEDYIFQTRPLHYNWSIITISFNEPFLAEEYRRYQLQRNEIITSPDSRLIMTCFDFRLNLSRWEKGESDNHEVMKKLLEVNNAERIYVFHVHEREKINTMSIFSVSPEMYLSEIDSFLIPYAGGIDRLVRSEPYEHPEYHSDKGYLYDFEPNETCLVGKDCYGGVYVAEPSDVVEPGCLYWQRL